MPAESPLVSLPLLYSNAKTGRRSHSALALSSVRNEAMWTPPQWRVAFPVTAAVMTAGLLALIWSSIIDAPWLAAISGGVISGLLLSIAWTLRLLIPSLFALHLFSALLALTSAWLTSPQAALPAALMALAVVASWIVGYHVLYTGSISRPIARKTEVFGAKGGLRALIVHHPGRSELQTRLQRTLAEVLASKGWQVELATAYEGNVVDMEAFDLLVLGAPTYNFRPARPLVDYLHCLKRLGGKPTLLVLTGGGMTEPAMSMLRRETERKGGRIVSVVEIWTGRPNAERHGIDDPQEIMRMTASAVARLVGDGTPNGA